MRINKLKKEILNLKKIDACRYKISCPEISNWKAKQINKRLQEIDELNSPFKNPATEISYDTSQV